MAAKLPKQSRAPLGAREVQFIRRPKTVMKLPVAQIAQAVDCNKTTVYDALAKGGTSVLRLGLPGGRSGRSLVYVSSARALAWSLAPDRYAMA